MRPDHSLRAVRALTDETLAVMERELAALYSGIGRPSIAPQMLLRAKGAGLLFSRQLALRYHGRAQRAVEAGLDKVAFSIRAPIDWKTSRSWMSAKSKRFVP